MSDISSLQAELYRQQSINAELRSELNELYMGVSQASSEMSSFRNHVCGTLEDSSNKIANSHERCIRTYEVQGEIDILYERFKRMELANKKIRECNNKKYYDFGNYRTVRKIVQGIMDNMNVTMVSDEVIYKSIERQHLQTPDYWLTCVLISVMAWKNNDRNLADRAMQKAIDLDKKGCAIFYMLFNMRVGRNDAALKWFRVYQECELKGSDERTFLLLFSLLSKTIHDDVDERTKSEIYDFINRVIALNAQQAGFSEQDVIDEIMGYLVSMQGSARVEYTLLQRCCEDYGEMVRMVLLAENNRNILQFLFEVNDVSELERNDYISVFMDEQIALPNQVEKEVYDEIEYNETIIACKGDVELANERYGAEKARREKELNLIGEMIRWVYGRGKEEANPQVRRNMFVLTGGLQQQAVEQYRDWYTSMETDVHPVTMGEYSTTCNFQDRQGESRKIQQFYEARRDAAIAGIKNTGAYVAFGLGALAFLAAIILPFVMDFELSLTLMLAAAGAIGVLVGFLTLRGNKKRKAQLEIDCQTNIAGKNDLMTKLFAEYAEFQAEYQSYDAYYEKIMQAFLLF